MLCTFTKCTSQSVIFDEDYSRSGMTVDSVFKYVN